MDFNHVDTFEKSTMLQPQSQLAVSQRYAAEDDIAWNPKQLENGKWACNHKCKDKTVYGLIINHLFMADFKFRCKHLCCREGVDKAPKPPKNPASSIRSPIHSGARSAKPGLQSKHITPKLRTDHKSKKIEQIDLSSGRDIDEYAKYGPRDFRKLHNLHKSVSKGPLVPTITKTKPSFSYARGERPNISFLPHEVETSEPTDKILDYGDDDWMDDLPSLSSLLSKKQENSGCLSTKDHPINSNPEIEKNSSDYEDGFSFSDIVELNRNSSDSKSQGQKAGWNEDSDELLPILTQSVKFSQHRNLGIAIESDDRLFCSTDSPEKPTQSQAIQAEVPPSRRILVAGKRIGVDPLESEFSSGNTRVSKRQKSSNQKQQEPIQGSNTKADQSQTRPKVVDTAIQSLGRPRPAWVDDFDPEFIAEYADFVEFV